MRGRLRGRRLQRLAERVAQAVAQHAHLDVREQHLRDDDLGRRLPARLGAQRLLQLDDDHARRLRRLVLLRQPRAPWG